MRNPNRKKKRQCRRNLSCFATISYPIAFLKSVGILNSIDRLRWLIATQLLRNEKDQRDTRPKNPPGVREILQSPGLPQDDRNAAKLYMLFLRGPLTPDH
jgi:hypothetical protein